MFNEKEDREYLNEPNIYSLALEKFIFSKYYSDLNNNNGSIEQVYCFSNEEQEESFNCLSKLPKKRVLTVGSSGDQILNSIFYGAEDVTLIDANLFSKYFIEYKIAAIKNLSHREFVDNFINDSSNIFNHTLFKRLFHDLSPDSQVFWGTLLMEVEGEEIYNNMVDTFSEPFKSIFYRNPLFYEKLKEKLQTAKINYINANFTDFPKFTDGQYDLILLSNIFDYVDEKDYVKVINELYDNNLTNGGQMQIRYALHNFYSTYTFLELFPDKKIERHIIPVDRKIFTQNHNYILTNPEDFVSQKANEIEM